MRTPRAPLSAPTSTGRASTPRWTSARAAMAARAYRAQLRASRPAALPAAVTAQSPSAARPMIVACGLEGEATYRKIGCRGKPYLSRYASHGQRRSQCHMRITPAGGRGDSDSSRRPAWRPPWHGQTAKLQREPECEPVRHGGPARLTKPGGLSLPGDHRISAIMMMTQDCLATSLNLPGCQDLLTYWQAGTQAGPAGPVTVSGPGRARCASGTVAVTRRGTAARRRHGS